MNGLKLHYLLQDLAGVQGSYLDLGCGGGAVAKAVKRERPDLDVHGGDLSRAVIAAASHDPQGVRFVVAPAERLPYRDGTFDAISVIDVLEHVDDPTSMLAEIRRVLRPGGLLHLVLPLEGQRGTLWRAIGTGTRWRAKVQYAGHIQVFDEQRYRHLADAAGLSVVRVRWSYHLLFQLVDILFFLLISIRGPLKTSFEDAAAERQGVAGPPLRALKGAIAAVGWYEARLMSWKRGGCGHFTSQRG
ncbi:MAG: class I SAM-dependent methyltransferase [Chloroflexi bacterium]|nr:MAG: class I SAM-dependent methyltransferase [Chloroflexota bacterium]TME20148.1 MAG: class I SAM-dependent methyltransferase [Chloroflexota bacterium]